MIRGDKSSIWHRIYGVAADNAIFLREEILLEGSPDQIKEALDHEGRHLQNEGMGHDRIREIQHKGDLRNLISKLVARDKETFQGWLKVTQEAERERKIEDIFQLSLQAIEKQLHLLPTISLEERFDMGDGALNLNPRANWLRDIFRRIRIEFITSLRIAPVINKEEKKILISSQTPNPQAPLVPTRESLSSRCVPLSTTRDYRISKKEMVYAIGRHIWDEHSQPLGTKQERQAIGDYVVRIMNSGDQMVFIRDKEKEEYLRSSGSFNITGARKVLAGWFDEWGNYRAGARDFFAGLFSEWFTMDPSLRDDAIRAMLREVNERYSYEAEDAGEIAEILIRLFKEVIYLEEGGSNIPSGGYVKFRDFSKLDKARSGMTFAELLDSQLYTPKQRHKIGIILARFGIERSRIVSEVMRDNAVSPYIKYELHEILIDDFINGFYAEGKEQQRHRYGDNQGELEELANIRRFFKEVLDDHIPLAILTGLLRNQRLNVLHVGTREQIFEAHASQNFGINILDSCRDPGAAIVHELMALSGSSDDAFNERVEEAYKRWRDGGNRDDIPSIKEAVSQKRGSSLSALLAGGVVDLTDIPLREDEMDLEVEGFAGAEEMAQALDPLIRTIRSTGHMTGDVDLSFFSAAGEFLKMRSEMRGGNVDGEDLVESLREGIDLTRQLDSIKYEASGSLRGLIPKIVATLKSADEALSRKARRYLIYIVVNFGFTTLPPDDLLLEMHRQGIDISPEWKRFFTNAKAYCGEVSRLRSLQRLCLEISQAPQPEDKEERVERVVHRELSKTEDRLKRVEELLFSDTADEGEILDGLVADEADDEVDEADDEVDEDDELADKSEALLVAMCKRAIMLDQEGLIEAANHAYKAAYGLFLEALQRTARRIKREQGFQLLDTEYVEDEDPVKEILITIRRDPKRFRAIGIELNSLAEVYADKAIAEQDSAAAWDRWDKFRASLLPSRFQRLSYRMGENDLEEKDFENLAREKGVLEEFQAIQREFKAAEARLEELREALSDAALLASIPDRDFAKMKNKIAANSAAGPIESLQGAASFQPRTVDEFLDGYIERYAKKVADARATEARTLGIPEEELEEALIGYAVPELLRVRQKGLEEAQGRISELRRLMQRPTLQEFRRALRNIEGGAKKEEELSADERLVLQVAQEEIARHYPDIELDPDAVLFVPESSWINDLFEFHGGGRFEPFLNENDRLGYLILLRAKPDKKDIARLIHNLIHELLHIRFNRGRIATGKKPDEWQLFHILEEAMVERTAIEIMEGIWHKHEETMRGGERPENYPYLQERELLEQLREAGGEKAVLRFLVEGDSVPMQGFFGISWDLVKDITNRMGEYDESGKHLIPHEEYEIALYMLTHAFRNPAALEHGARLLDVINSVDPWDYFEGFDDGFSAEIGTVVTVCMCRANMRVANDILAGNELSPEGMKDRLVSYIREDRRGMEELIIKRRQHLTASPTIEQRAQIATSP